jgi:Polyketide cyclase / dehydrase and lipid transport
MQQSNTHFSFTVPINNSLEKVWTNLTDVETWHEWDTELISAKLDGVFTLGAKGTMIPKTGPKLKFYISEYSPQKSYTINTVMPVGELVIKRTLKLENSQVYFTDDIRFTGWLKYVFGVMLGNKFKNILPEVLQNFKRISESV